MRPQLLPAAQRILLTLWVGGLWVTGYLVAPVLFSVLDDRRLAGELVGAIFHAMGYAGLISGGLLLVTLLYQTRTAWRSWRVWAVTMMLVLTSVIQFGVQPVMQALKAATPGGFIPGSAEAARFGMLHGISSTLFLVTSLLGLALVAFELKKSVRCEE